MIRTTSGLLPLAALGASLLAYYTFLPFAGSLAAALAVAAVLVALCDRRASRGFVALCLGLMACALATRSDGLEGLRIALYCGGFVVALFTALVPLRTVAAASPAIISCGRFLAARPASLRYLSLTIGGQFFGLVLLYGSIALLGSLATEAERRAPSPDLRLRRMLLAILRGFAATLCWSPFGYGMAISIPLVPGAKWSEAVGYCLPMMVGMLALGWVMDAWSDRQASLTDTVDQDLAAWARHLRPLSLLLLLLGLALPLVCWATGVTASIAVMLVVPALALGWSFHQGGARASLRAGQRLATKELPTYGPQIVLLFTAAFIGSLGAFLAVPLVHIDLGSMPPAVLLVATVWIVPLTGQIGMNPILAVSLLAPLYPPPGALGLHPAAVIAAITGGWALSTSTSPYTASVLMVGHLSGETARQVGIGWNWRYGLALGALISAWVIFLSILLKGPA